LISRHLSAVYTCSALALQRATRFPRVFHAPALRDELSLRALRLRRACNSITHLSLEECAGRNAAVPVSARARAYLPFPLEASRPACGCNSCIPRKIQRRAYSRLPSRARLYVTRAERAGAAVDFPASGLSRAFKRAAERFIARPDPTRSPPSARALTSRVGAFAPSRGSPVNVERKRRYVRNNDDLDSTSGHALCLSAIDASLKARGVFFLATFSRAYSFIWMRATAVRY